MTTGSLQTYKCQNCGAQLTFSPQDRSLTCEFCGSNFLVETPMSEATRAAAASQRIIPFAVDENAARGKLDEWMGKGLFTPSNLKAMYSVRDSKSVYLPFWLYLVDANSQWSGQYSETRYRRVSKTRQRDDGSTESYEEDEPYQVWFDRSGTHQERYQEYVCASQGISQEEANKLQPYSFEALQEFRPEFLAGFKAEDPARDKDQSWEIAQRSIREKEREACSRMIERLQSCTTQLGEYQAWLALLPLYVYNYTYNGELFRVLINGQTSKVVGDKPKDKRKLLIFWIALIAVIVLIMALIVFFFVINRRGGTPVPTPIPTPRR